MNRKEDYWKEEYFEETPKKRCFFKPPYKLPLRPFLCPVCGKQTFSYDDEYLIAYQMCASCAIWWEEKVDSNMTFSEKLQEFFKRLKLRDQKT